MVAGGELDVPVIAVVAVVALRPALSHHLDVENTGGALCVVFGAR